MKVVIIEPLGVEEGELLAMIREVLGDRVEIVYYSTKITDTAGLIECEKDAEVIVVSNLPLNVQVIEGCRNLELLAVAFTGVDRTIMDVRRKNGIMMCSCAGYSARTVAGLVFGMLTSLYRNVVPCDKVYRERGIKDGLAGLGLEGKTSGVVRTEIIGLRMTVIAQTFGCRVLAYGRIARDVPGVRYVGSETLLAECDVVSPHAPFTEETRGLMNEEYIGLMKKNAVLINAAEGPVVGNDVLAEALKESRITGACIDVFENEPLAKRDHPLFSTPNIIVVPHAASVTREALVKRVIIAFDNMVSHLDETPGNVIG